MECAFQIGDEIVCVRNDNEPLTNGRVVQFQPDTPLPQIGTTYTVAAMVPANSPLLPDGWHVALELAELSGVTMIGSRWRFPHCWFRKVEKTKTETSIEIFRKIDRDVFAKEPVRA